MFIHSARGEPQSLDPHRKIFSPMRESSPSLIASSLKTHSYSDQKAPKPIKSEAISNNNGLSIFEKSQKSLSEYQKSFRTFEKHSSPSHNSPYSPTKIALLCEEPRKVLAIQAQVINTEENTERRTGRSMDLVGMNQDVVRKFNILLEKNEMLNEVLEKKIRKLNQCSQENACLAQEIDFLQRKNAEFQLELETSRTKIAVLESEMKNKNKEEHDKNEIINEFKALIEELEREMSEIRETDRENRTNFEKNRNEYDKILTEKTNEMEKLKTYFNNVLNEKINEIEDLKKESQKKKKLEGQLLVFIQENEKIRKILEEKIEENSTVFNQKSGLEGQIAIFEEEITKKEQTIEEKNELLLKTVKELEKITDRFSIKSEEINILQQTFNENLEKLKALDTSQVVLLEENKVLKNINDDLDEKNKEKDKIIKNLTQKINELQNSHLSLAKSNNDKSGEYQKKLKIFEAENRKLREEIKKNEEIQKNLKENFLNNELSLKKMHKEIEELKANDAQNAIELDAQKRENFDLSEKIKIKIKGYSILKSHFYGKYEEMIKLLIQKDKELQKMQLKNGGKENALGRVSKIYEVFQRKKTEEQNDLENELNKDFSLLKEGKLSEKSILECLDSNTTMNSIKD